MENEEVLQLEREYLLNQSKQIQDRVREYNQTARSVDRLTERDFPSWNGNSVPELGLHSIPENDQRTASSSRAPAVPLGGNHSRGSQSGMAQYRGLSPGSNLLVVSQQGRESTGHYSPGVQSKQTTQNSWDRDWPSLNNDRGSTLQGPPNRRPLKARSSSRWRDGTLREQNIKRLDPFARFADITLVESFEAGEVEDILDGIISNTAPVENFAEGKESDIIDIDPRFLVSTTRYLKDTLVVVYTMDLKVSFKYVENWADVVFRQTLGVQVVSICSLSRNCFHICLDSGQNRNHIFANAPFYMGDSMVYTLPWDPRFNPAELRTRSVPIWVELPDVPPNCISYGLALMNKIGTLMYASKNAERQQTNLLKGCILMDISKPMKEELYFCVPGFGSKLRRQKVRYSGFPDACFACRQRGHIVANCPTVKAREAEEQAAVAAATAKSAAVKTPEQKQDGEPRKNAAGRKGKETENKTDFQVVKRKGQKPFKDPKFRPPQVVDNRFGVLTVEDSEGEEEEDWPEEVPKGDNPEDMEGTEQEDEEESGDQAMEESQPQTQERNVNVTSQASMPPGQGAADLPLKPVQGDHMEATGDEKFTSFEEAERSNVRLASKMDQEDSTRMSCANNNRLDFAEVRKKFKDTEGQQPEKEGAGTSNSGKHSEGNKGGNKYTLGKKPQKGT
ncbi:hypothetical protein R1sor_011072 [Riccia sorocarpa]|uniref:CCHC-type domain-containing protein n=1 Tax=Riccia sorocarpa TaxID=122646 RepID=A0ABD3I131_9MARC